MDEILFEITTKHLEKGLQGIPVGYCTVSHVHPENGLMYRGKNLESLIHLSIEEIIYLLYFGRLPQKEDRSAFIRQMTNRYFASSGVIRLIRSLPASTSPMKLFATSILFLGMLEATGDYKKDCLNVLGKLPAIVAEVINHHAGWGETPQVLEDYGYMDNLLYRLQTPRGDRALLHKIFSLYIILHCDIGGSDVATFVGKSVASSGANMYESLSSSICAIGGGKMKEVGLISLEYVRNALQYCREEINKESITEYIQLNPIVKEQVQSLYSLQEDVRATILYRFAEEQFATHPFIKTATLLHEVMVDILYKERGKHYYPSAATISNVILQASGFPYQEYYPILFGLSRCIGAAIQIVYERCDARGGKGIPIMSPVYLYKMN